MTTTALTYDPETELSGAQVGRLLDFPAPKLATYVSSPERWLTFLPNQQATGPGRYRYYSMADVLTIAMLIDTSANFSQTLSIEFRRALAEEIRRQLLVPGSIDPSTQVSATVDRVTVLYTPRWEILETDPDSLFD